MTTSDVDAMSLESVIDNPALLEAAKALAAEGDEEPRVPDPLDGPVTLPAGFHRRTTTPEGTEVEAVTTAWVRELNGEDEEKIARAKMKDAGTEFVRAILEAGVERLGEKTPTKDDFDSLVMGDRDFLLLEIARATYGDELAYDEISCPLCGEKFSLTLSMKDDIPVKRLKSIDDAKFDVRLKKDRVASVHLPTVDVAPMLVKTENPAEANTVLITNAVLEIRGPNGTVTIAGDPSAARRLSVSDRETLVTEMSDRMPGPQYNEVKFNHEPGCGKEIRLPITLADLFRSL